MKMRVFELERVQSIYENTVDFNLTESGFHPLRLSEFLTDEQLRDLADTVLGYGQTNGSIALRDAVAKLYPNQDSGNVLVTNGSAEANFVACHTLLEAGDEVVMMLPNYMQIWGVAEEIGAIPRPFHLREENRWAPDLDELAKAVTKRTKMLAVCNPNNPTGYVLTEDEMKAIVAIAEKADAWIYADEVYRGAELDGKETTSFLGTYPKAIVCGGLSKAYALPGLRVGWLAGPTETIGDAWTYHDYTTITAGILSHMIAEIALSSGMRTRILDRNRSMLQENLRVMQAWVDGFDGRFRFVPPLGGGMAFIRYDLDINSTDLADWLRREQSVFVLAGDCYGMDRFVRLGIGAETEHLRNGLERIRAALSARFGI